MPFDVYKMYLLVPELRENSGKKLMAYEVKGTEMDIKIKKKLF